MTYPLGLQLRGREVLVVGGGPVATRRIRALVSDGAHVIVVAPSVSQEIREQSHRGELVWHERGFQSSDLDQVWLVLAHTSEPFAQDEVAVEAERRRIFCVKGGDPHAGTAWVPSVAKAHGVTVAVNAGRDPRRAKAVSSWVSAALDAGEAPVRPRSGAAALAADQVPGTVALVGGGPGDMDLLTVRGRFLVAMADVVVADRLGPREVLTRIREDARVIEVGKKAGHHPVPQGDINQILVQEARKGLRVVRLKGGDPFVLGRGGEEVEYCAAHGIETEVVPGVTSAISVPAAAGIPVTHRGVATGFSVITGHQHIAEVPGGAEHTLVLLMGVTRLSETASRLIDAGRRPSSTPVAVIERGWTPEQRTTFGTLSTIGKVARERGVRAPAVIVVGDVVRLSPEFV
ncbi:uroporphyrinogen-III C-methyltransferase [Kocuria sp. TGY1127_2]|uniref:uroporphyrinogen-III C-methyltransferase n=1 Tax=Kocuria sp. TGY1127_2 TaxID=2711328 RepID=UPI0015BBB809|nr:uroporphyrinogen-III C-methyltransferase [Kocuria sp. TGY1127_2]